MMTIRSGAMPPLHDIVSCGNDACIRTCSVAACAQPSYHSSGMPPAPMDCDDGRPQPSLLPAVYLGCGEEWSVTTNEINEYILRRISLEELTNRYAERGPSVGLGGGSHAALTRAPQRNTLTPTRKKRSMESGVERGGTKSARTTQQPLWPLEPIDQNSYCGWGPPKPGA